MNFFRVLWIELRKEILTTLSYKTQWCGEFLALIIFYLFLSKISGTLELSRSGYCLWFYSILIIGDISGKISSETRIGTFEQMYLSTFSIITLLVTKIIASIARCALLMIVLLLLLIFKDATSLNLILTPSIWLAALCITPGLFGFSLILGGLALIFKDTGWIVNIVNNSILFLSGIFISPESFPNWLQNISVSIPTTQAIVIIYQNDLILVNWLLLCAFSAIYLCIGCASFFICERIARKQGILGHY